MAARDRFEGDQKVVVDGHFIEYSDRLPIFAGRPPYHFERSVTFECRAPTSWAFRVTFEQPPEADAMVCHVAVKRRDAKSIPMNVDFWMAVFCGTLTQLPPRSFQLRGMQRLTEETRTFEGVVPYGVLEQLGNRGILFQVSFGVHGCHMTERRKRMVRRLDKVHEDPVPKSLHSKL